jgi:hypothetical protein
MRTRADSVSACILAMREVRNPDRSTVRFAVPPLPIAGMPEPLAVYMDFDAKTVDAMLERLTILRNQMLPPLPAPSKRN